MLSSKIKKYIFIFCFFLFPIFVIGQQNTDRQLFSSYTSFNKIIEQLLHTKKIFELGVLVQSTLPENTSSVSNSTSDVDNAESGNTWTTVIIISILLNVVFLVLLFLGFKNNRKLKKESKEQIKEINYLKLFKINKEESAVATTSDKDLNKFGILDKLMKVDKLYLNPACNREMLIKELGIDKNSFSELLKKYRFDNLPDYINRFRLEESIRLLNHEYQLSIDQIAKQSGFGTSRSLQRQFKDKYNISPNEYRKLINKDKKIVTTEDI